MKCVRDENCTSTRAMPLRCRFCAGMSMLNAGYGLENVTVCGCRSCS